jgi:hypothetical protein
MLLCLLLAALLIKPSLCTAVVVTPARALSLQTYAGVDKYVERLLEARKGKNLTPEAALVPAPALSAADVPCRWTRL